MPNWRFSNYANRLVPSAIRGLADMPGAADTIHFGPGQPRMPSGCAPLIAAGATR